MRVVYDDATVLPSRGTKCTLAEGKTRQEDAKSADVNEILARVLRGAVPLPQPLEDLVYADVSGIVDFRDAMEKVTRANSAFMQLDAKVRSAYDNDPALFLDAFQSEDGVRKLEELGVVKVRRPEAERDAAEAAVEDRAAKRREARELAARLEAAKSPPVSK
jgi:hypothetical protein